MDSALIGKGLVWACLSERFIELRRHILTRGWVMELSCKDRDPPLKSDHNMQCHENQNGWIPF